MPTKARGARGSWFASVKGEALPCVHKHWTSFHSSTLRYDDPQARPGDPKFEELAAALRKLGRAIMTDDAVGPNASSFKRKRSGGYIAVYAVSGIEFDGEGLRFQFDRRLENLV